MLKKFLTFMMAIMLFTQICVFAEEVDSVQTRIYVAESGNDTNDGTENSPFATIKRAKEEVRKYNTSMTGNIEVIIGEGTYFLDDTLVFSPEDSGNNGYKVIYKGINKPTISGGMKIDGFEVLENGMWKTNVPKLSVMRELYVNKGRRYRASTEREIVGLSNYNDPNTAYEYDGIVFDRDLLDTYENAEDMSFRWGIGWKHHEMRVDEIIVHPDDSKKVIAIMQQPTFELAATCAENSHPARFDFGFRAENAFELLDTAGEYYFNEKTNDLYYLPLEGENIETAEVFAPVLEYLAKVHGVGMDKTKNIEFDNITFAHCAYNMPDRIGHTHGQWSDLQVFDSMTENYGHGAIDIFNSDSINLNNCVVYGAGYTGIDIYSSSNCNITGNTIYDIGGSAIDVGLPITVLETEEPQDAMGNAMREARFEVSSAGSNGNGQMNIVSSNAYWIPKNDVISSVKSWVKVDFKKEIEIDKIQFVLHTAEAAKRNFEIVVSNDADFLNTTTIIRVGNAGVTEQSYSIEPSTTEKFRYMMIRKTQVEEFGLRNLKVFSKDVTWQPTDICKNITIKNNYITRASSYYYGLPNITTYYATDVIIDHNEIYWSPYTAIGAGWGWSNTTSENLLARTIITNNKIEYYNMESQDGGAIYTLSRNKDSIISGNYSSEGHGPYGAYYFDQGSSDFTVENNVSENSSCPVFIWIASDEDINVTNTYSNSTLYRNDGTNCSVEPLNTYIKGNPSLQAKRIIDNAGLESEYENIKELVPDALPYMGLYEYDDYSSVWQHWPGAFYSEYGNGVEVTAQTTHDLAETGDMLGQYSSQKKLMLKKRIDEFSAETRTSDGVGGLPLAERMIRIKEAQKALEDSLYRLSYAETLSFAQNLANDSSINVSTEARNTFESVINNLKTSADDEYTKLKALENAINDFDKATVNAQIKGFEIKEYDFYTEIDKENKTVTVYAEESADLSSLTAYTELSNGSVSSVDFSSTFSLSNPIQATITNGSVQENWTIKAEKPVDNLMNSNSWWNWYASRPQQDGETLEFSDSEKAYMYLAKKADSIEFDFSTEKLDNQNGVSFIFLSEAGELIPDNKTGARSYFELKFLKDSICLNRVENGVTTIIYGSQNDNNKVNSEVINTSEYLDSANEMQHVVINTGLTGQNVKITVDINGKRAVDTQYNSNTAIAEGYFGIKSNTTTVYAKNIVLNSNEDTSVEIKGSNVALGKTVEAGDSHDWYPANKLVNGGTSGEGNQWKTNKKSAENTWAYVDLGKAYSINAVVVYPWMDDVTNTATKVGGTILVSNDPNFATYETIGTYDYEEGPIVLEGDISSKWRYVKVQGPTASVGSQWGIYELEVYSDDVFTPEGNNVALKKTAKAGSEWGTTQNKIWYPAGSAIDGKSKATGTDTYGEAGHWRTEANCANNAWLRVDLGKAYSLNAIVVYPWGHTSSAQTGVGTIYLSNDPDFLTGVVTAGTYTITSGDQSAQTIELFYDAIDTKFRYVKVQAPSTGSGKNSGIWELEVYSTDVFTPQGENVALKKTAKAGSEWGASSNKLWYPAGSSVDGVKTSTNLAGGAGHWRTEKGCSNNAHLVIDLGKAYPLNAIVAYPWANAGEAQTGVTTVYLSNDPDFMEGVVNAGTYTTTENDWNAKTIELFGDAIDGKFRYVKVQGPNVISSRYFGIWELEVYSAPIPITDLEIKGIENGLTIGEEKQILLYDQNEELIEDAYKITYKSSDENVATVSDSGKITAHKVGFSEITVSVQQLKTTDKTVDKTVDVYVYDNGVCIYDAVYSSDKTVAKIKVNEDKNDVYVITAQYSDTNKLSGVQVAYDGDLSVDNELELNLKTEDGKTSSIFVWTKDMTPLCEAVNPKKVEFTDYVDFVVEVEDGREPVILQLTDTQIIDAAQERTEDRLTGTLDTYWATDQIEERCYDYLSEIINETNPDLILLTGDLVYGEFDDAGTSFTSFVNFMEGFNIPWAPVFGNHENESAKGVDWQCQQLENAENCLFKQRTLTGNGNYTVGIKQGNKLKRVFFMMDSNGCGGMSTLTAENGHSTTSVGFGTDQIEWYTKLGTDINTLYPDTKIAFAFHIQPLIFQTAYSKYGFTNSGTQSNPINIDTHSDKAEGDFGYIGRDLKSAWDTDFSVYQGIKNLGTDLILVGHEHCNSASVVYDGIRFQFGQKSSTYDRTNYISSTGVITGAYHSTNEPIVGGTVMKLSEDNGEITDAYIYYCGDVDLGESQDITVNGLKVGTELTAADALDVSKTKIEGEAAYAVTANSQGKLYVDTSLFANKNTFTFSVFIPETSTNKLAGYGEFAIRVKDVEPTIDGKSDGYIDYDSSAENTDLKLVHGEWKTYTVDISAIGNSCTEFAFVIAKGNTVYFKDLSIK